MFVYKIILVRFKILLKRIQTLKCNSGKKDVLFFFDTDVEFQIWYVYIPAYYIIKKYNKIPYPQI